MDRSEAHDAAGSWASLRRRYGDCCPPRPSGSQAMRSA